MERPWNTSLVVSEIGPRLRTGEQGAAAATVRKRFPRVYSGKRCRLAETRMEYWTEGLGSSMGKPFQIRAPGFSSLPLEIYITN
jgi:hypothetical protein